MNTKKCNVCDEEQAIKKFQKIQNFPGKHKDTCMPCEHKESLISKCPICEKYWEGTTKYQYCCNCKNTNDYKSSFYTFGHMVVA